MAIREITYRLQTWTVWATFPSLGRTGVLSGYETGWLTFECAGAKRRLFPVPAGWEELSEAELVLLFDRAELAPPSRTEASRQRTQAGP